MLYLNKKSDALFAKIIRKSNVKRKVYLKKNKLEKKSEKDVNIFYA